MHASISQQNINDRTAIVIGSSMAGLLSARVLADYFARVIVVERDTLPQEPQTRTGVPQANHVHVLLARGKRILEKLFPGIDSEIKEAGAPKIDWAKEYTLKGLTKKFQKQLAQVLKTPWLMATSDDCRWESTEGGKPDRMTHFMHKYSV